METNNQIQIEELLANIKVGSEARSNLSHLRKLLKEEENRSILYNLLQNDSDFLLLLLNHSDPKTRKNAALLIGDLNLLAYSDVIYQSYLKEETLFVKASFLDALQNLDYREYIFDFKKRLQQLTKSNFPENEQKHRQEEIKLLTKMIIEEDGIDLHTFTGFHTPHDCIFLTNKFHKEVIEEQFLSVSCDTDVFTPFPSGVRIYTKNLEPFLTIRTYSHLFFVIPDCKVCEAEPISAAKKIALSSLLSMIQSDHTGKAPYYYRVELKSSLTLDQKSNYLKKFCNELERASNRQFINSKTNYEFEIRFIENKDGNFNVLVRYLTMIDHRFDYRQNVVAQSIKPSDAALLVQLAKPYLKEDAQVLDPFCGVGTMLIERQKMQKANTSYALDIQEDTIKKAKDNTLAAKQIIHFINRDFFSFQHEYSFDEIFTNMPFSLRDTTPIEIVQLYQKFFANVHKHLTATGIIIMYSHDPSTAKEHAKKNNYQLLQETYLSSPKKAALLIFQKDIKKAP